jgi:hypothetical protein
MLSDTAACVVTALAVCLNMLSDTAACVVTALAVCLNTSSDSAACVVTALAVCFRKVKVSPLTKNWFRQKLKTYTKI